MAKIDVRNLKKSQPVIKGCHNQIGFDPESKKWYGWSHRAVYGFGIGHVIKKGDLTLSSGYTQGSDLDKKAMVKIKKYPIWFKAKTLTDCKNLAKLFAQSVS